MADRSTSEVASESRFILRHPKAKPKPFLHRQRSVVRRPAAGPDRLAAAEPDAPFRAAARAITRETATDMVATPHRPHRTLRATLSRRRGKGIGQTVRISHTHRSIPLPSDGCGRALIAERELGCAFGVFRDSIMERAGTGVVQQRRGRCHSRRGALRARGPWTPFWFRRVSLFVSSTLPTVPSPTTPSCGRLHRRTSARVSRALVSVPLTSSNLHLRSRFGERFPAPKSSARRPWQHARRVRSCA